MQFAFNCLSGCEMRKKKLVLIVNALLLASCASKPIPRAEYTGLPQQEQGWSRVYFSAGVASYLGKGGFVNLWSVHQVGPVFINGQEVGSTAEDEHFVVDLLPGTYELNCAPSEPEKNYSEKTTFVFSAGETRYLACDQITGAWASKGVSGYVGVMVSDDYLSKNAFVERSLDESSKLVSYRKFEISTSLTK